MQRRALQVKASYESTRLAEIYIADAYEKIIPTLKCSAPIQEKTDVLTLKVAQTRRH